MSLQEMQVIQFKMGEVTPSNISQKRYTMNKYLKILTIINHQRNTNCLNFLTVIPGYISCLKSLTHSLTHWSKQTIVKSGEQELIHWWSGCKFAQPLWRPSIWCGHFIPKENDLAYQRYPCTSLFIVVLCNNISDIE